MTNFLSPFFNTDNENDGVGGVSELNGVRDVIGVSIGSNTFVYAAGRDDAGIQIFSFSNGLLTASGAAIDDATNDLTFPRDLEHTVAGGSDYLLVKGYYSITVARIDATTGALTVTDTVTDDAISLLQGNSDLEIATIGGTSYVYVASQVEHAVTAYSLDGTTGTLTQVDQVRDSDNVAYQLNGVKSLHIDSIGNRDFLFTASYGDNGVSVFEINGNGTLTSRDHWTDSGSLELNDADGLATAKVGSATYLYVSGASDNGISVFSVANNGMLTSQFDYNFGTSAYVGLYGPQHLEVIQYQGANILLAAAFWGDGLVAYSVEDDGSLIEIDRIVDDSTLNLNGPSFISSISQGGTDYLLVNGLSDNGVSAFEVGGDEDVLGGTMSNDRMFGFGGDDVLAGKAGADSIYGGDGNDVLVGHKGNDLLRGGDGGDILIGRYGTADRADYTGSNAGVNVDLLNGTASGGHATGDILIQIEDLIGSNKADTLAGDIKSNKLTGAGGDDTIHGNGAADDIFGGNGNDDLSGDGGNDKVYGGSGTNTLDGGGGNDRLFGGGGAETILGGSGNDTLRGKGGKDFIDAGSGNDSIVAGAGKDVVIGGMGTDVMSGGGGGDSFKFNDNSGASDEITDFTNGVDKIDVSGHSAVTSFADITSFQFGPDLIVQFGTSGDAVLLRNFAKADLDMTDFSF
ncbi:MAG: hypothetical protein D6754_07230 [Alphaproteobacteria bacterium]|nr:MAG: hypothetical protein D6754_07230 [Alphaproteobacteria bacterium]